MAKVQLLVGADVPKLGLLTVFFCLFFFGQMRVQSLVSFGMQSIQSSKVVHVFSVRPTARFVLVNLQVDCWDVMQQVNRKSSSKSLIGQTYID